MLPDQESYRRLVSGRTTGVGATLVRAFLSLLSCPYGWATGVRNVLYDRDLLPTYAVSVPVICVGNLTTGGTGKTPLVAWLCHYLEGLPQDTTQQQYPCVILTRGYKGAQGDRDEPALLSRYCPGTPISVCADRVAGAREAIAKYAPRALIMDDGFQHRRLSRHLDILTIDATTPFGFDRLLPSGLLRESLKGLRRAQAVVITRADQANEASLRRIESRVTTIHPGMLIARACHQPASLVCADGEERDVDTLVGRRVFAFCGIGNPQAFLQTLDDIDVQIVGSGLFKDHHPFSARDMVTLGERAEGLGAEWVVTTEKNMIGLNEDDWTSTLPLACVRVQLSFSAGETALKSLIGQTLGGTMPAEP